MKIAIFADSHGDAKILRHYPNIVLEYQLSRGRIIL